MVMVTEKMDSILSCHVRVSEWIHTLLLTECQGTPCSKQARNVNLSDFNCFRTHNYLVRKRTLNHLAKLTSAAKRLSVRLRTKWLLVRVQLQSKNGLLTQFQDCVYREFIVLKELCLNLWYLKWLTACA